MTELPDHLKPIRDAIDKELRRQADKHLGYYSSSEPDETYGSTYDGTLELNALTLAVTKATLDAQAELVPTLACSPSKLEYVKAALRVFYTRMVPNVQDPIKTMVDRTYATDRLGELEGQ